jgi:hypothetical protein
LLLVTHRPPRLGTTRHICSHALLLGSYVACCRLGSGMQ